MRRLVQEGYDKATQILTEKRADLDTIANGLLEFETLTGEELMGLLEGKRPVREEPAVVGHAAARLVGAERRVQSRARRRRHGADAGLTIGHKK